MLYNVILCNSFDCGTAPGHLDTVSLKKRHSIFEKTKLNTKATKNYIS